MKLKAGEPGPGPDSRGLAPLYGRLDAVEHRHRGIGPYAAREEAGGADVAGPQRVAPPAVLRAGPLDLGRGVHRERPRPFQPALVAGAVEELQERVAVAGGAVAEAGALGQRPRRPGELAARDRSEERRV